MAETSRRIVAALSPRSLSRKTKSRSSARVTWPGSRTPLEAANSAEAPKVPQVGLDGVRAVAGLEREIVAEALEPEVAGRPRSLPRRVIGRAGVCGRQARPRARPA